MDQSVHTRNRCSTFFRSDLTISCKHRDSAQRHYAMAATVSQCDMCRICTWLFCRLGFSSTFGLETVDFLFTCQCFLAHMWSRADAGHCDSGPRVFRPSFCHMQTNGSPPMPHLFFWHFSFRRQAAQVHEGFRCTL